MGQLSREHLAAQRLTRSLDHHEDDVVAITGDHIIYRGRKLKIIEVKEEVIAGEKVVTYKTREGAVFQYWTKQKKIIPPLKLEWYQFTSTNRVFIEPWYLNQLLREAVKEAGSIDRLVKQLRKLGVEYSKTQLHYNLKRSTQTLEAIGVEVGFLRGLLAYLNKPYSDANDHIKALGSTPRKSVKTRFPLNLDKPEIGTILAATLGNGSYPINGRFTYKNTNKEMIEKIKNAIRETIGETPIEERQEKGHNKPIYTTRTSTEIIRKILENMGLQPGPKTNPKPALEILPPQAKTKYIQQTFDDEAWITKSDHQKQIQIAYTKSIRLPVKDNEEIRKKLNIFIDLSLIHI